MERTIIAATTMRSPSPVLQWVGRRAASIGAHRVRNGVRCALHPSAEGHAAMADAALPAAAQVTLDAPEASINAEPLALPSAPAAQQQ